MQSLGHLYMQCVTEQFPGRRDMSLNSLYESVKINIRLAIPVMLMMPATVLLWRELSTEKKIKYSYWHLNEGTPIAINPRTGKPFKRGDKVYQGEVIAYSGKTGNANDVDFPHLHLVVKDEKGNKLNPEDYINGSVSDTESNGRREIKETKIIGIKCDESDDDIYTFYPIADNSESE